MDRQGPRFRGGPEGRHGDGTNRLSDTEDSVVTRKRSLRGRRQEKDDQEEDDQEEDDQEEDDQEEDDQEYGDSGGYWEPHPAYDDHDDDDNDRMNPGRRSTRGGPQDRRGAGSHDMDDMSLPPRGPGCGKGNGTPDTDWSWESFDLPTLRKIRAHNAEELRMLHQDRANHDDIGDTFRRATLDYSIKCLDVEIADLEEEQSESGNMIRGMRLPTHMMVPNPRQNRAGGRGSFETRGELLDDTPDTIEILALKWQRDSLKKRLIALDDPKGISQEGRLQVARLLNRNLDDTTQAIARLELEQRQGGKTPRRMGPPPHMMDPNPHQSRAGGRGSFETRGELLDDTLDTTEILVLKRQRDRLKKRLLAIADSGDLKGDRLETARMLDKDLDFTNQAIARLELERQRDSLKKRLLVIADYGDLKGDRLEVARVLDKELDDTTQAIDRLELEQCQSGKTPRGTGQPSRRGDQEDYDDEESDYEPRGPRRGYPESAAGYR